MSLPLLVMGGGRPAVSADDVDTDLSTLSPDLSRFLLQRIFDKTYVHIVFVRKGTPGNDGAEWGEAYGPTQGAARSLFVPLDQTGTEAWMAAALDRQPYGEMVFVDIDFYGEMDHTHGPSDPTRWPLLLPAEDVLGMPPVVRLVGPPGARSQYELWTDWSRRMLQVPHQTAVRAVERIEGYHVVAKTLVVMY
jgi:hypothetical protein